MQPSLNFLQFCCQAFFQAQLIGLQETDRSVADNAGSGFCSVIERVSHAAHSNKLCITSLKFREISA